MKQWSSVSVLIYVVTAFGFAYVLGHSTITKRFREWAFDFTDGRRYPLRWLVELLECPMCCGVHEGFWFWILLTWLYPPQGISFTASVDIPIALIVAFFTAGSNFILGRATGLVDNPRG